MKHLWLRHFHPFRELETNSLVQLRVHKLGRRFWMANVPVYVAWFFISPKTFIAAGVLLTGIYSLYANWSDDDAAVASIQAARNTAPPASVLEPKIEAQLDGPLG